MAPSANHACACGALIGPLAKRCQRCRCRRAQSRYRRTEKGRATTARYQSSGVGRAAAARYRAGARGQLTMLVNNDRRVFVGSTYRGKAQTREWAEAIRLHIKERIREFISQQAADA